MTAEIQRTPSSVSPKNIRADADEERDQRAALPVGGAEVAAVALQPEVGLLAGKLEGLAVPKPDQQHREKEDKIVRLR
jgi:hypothetical protein